MTPRTAAEHPVWAGGPDCDPSCPGDWSAYHDGYAWGREQAETAAAPLRDALRGLVAAEDGLLVVTSDHAKEEWEVALAAARRALDEPIEHDALDREVEG
jgi:hypothetical protein